MVNACLIIVFNHRYDRNIPVLEKIYSSRFSSIFFLVPFYDGNQPNVIPVYESSHYFQSFFAQGYHRFFQPSFTHYIFVGDDCILHPAINQHNLDTTMGLPEGADFLPEIIELHKIKGDPWWHAFKGVDFFNNRKGAEIRKELPSREDAVAKFKEHGVDVQPLTRQNIFGAKKPRTQKWWQYFAFSRFHYDVKWRKYKKQGRVELPYPIAGSYSDVLVITKESIFDFCRYCGILAAAGLFVEIAIPTALLLSANKIAGEKDLRLKGKALWTPEEIAEVETLFGRSLKSLMAGFPEGQLFYHPIKLSKWNNDL